MTSKALAVALGVGLALSMVAPLGASASSPGTPLSAGAKQVLSTGVRPGVDALVVPDLATVQRLLGASDQVESGNANAYVATYSPEFRTGYFAVTLDQNLSSRAARSQLAQLIGSARPSQSELALNNQVVIVFSRYTSAEINESLARLTASLESSRGGAAFYYDPATDSILLTAPAGFVVPNLDVAVTREAGEVGSAYYRENMPSPYRGGGTIYSYNVNRTNRCTSGIPAYNASGTRGYFTAAHCSAPGDHVFASSTLSGGSNTGIVSHRYGTTAVDAEFVSGKTYEGFVYTGTSLADKKPVAGTWFPAAGVGNRLCFSGSTTNVQCGNAVVTYAGNFCYWIDPGGPDVCNTDMIALRGGVATEPGDSGGPVYANFGNTAKVSGIIRGYKDPLIGESTTFAVDWRKIVATYGASLMFG